MLQWLPRPASDQRVCSKSDQKQDHCRILFLDSEQQRRVREQHLRPLQLASVVVESHVSRAPEVDVGPEFPDEDSNHRLVALGDGGQKGRVTNFRPEAFTSRARVLKWKKIEILIISNFLIS